MRPLAWQFKAVTLAAVVAVPVWRGATGGGATSGRGGTSEWPGQVGRGPHGRSAAWSSPHWLSRAPGLPRSSSEPSWGAMAASTPELGALSLLLSWPSAS